MSILTSKQRWYQSNREKAIEQARKWRLEHPERYRELQKAAKRRKRQQLSPKTAPQPIPVLPVGSAFVPAPGFDPRIHGVYEHFCLRHGIDPTKSWVEETDEYFG